MNYNQMVIHWTEPLENADKVNIYEISYQRSTDTEPKIARVVGYIILTLHAGNFFMGLLSSAGFFFQN